MTVNLEQQRNVTREIDEQERVRKLAQQAQGKKHGVDPAGSAADQVIQGVGAALDDAHRSVATGKPGLDGSIRQLVDCVMPKDPDRSTCERQLREQQEKERVVEQNLQQDLARDQRRLQQAKKPEQPAEERVKIASGERGEIDRA